MPDVEENKTVDIDTSGPGAEIELQEEKDESVVDTEASNEEKKEQPFFFYVAHYAPHRPLHALEKDIQKLVKADLEVNLLDSGVIYVDTFAAKMVSDALKGIVPTSRQVVLTGDGIKSNAIVEVRFGTLLSELVHEVDGYNEVEEMVLHIGDFMTGIQVLTDEIAITSNTNAFNISEYRDDEEDVCIKCGDCNDVCPVGILPQNIMDAELRSVNSRIVDLNTNLCTECGLCTYVCPSKINVVEWVRRAKRRVG